MSAPRYLIVRLAAAGDVLLTTGLARALRLAVPQCRIGWLVSPYAAPMLHGNPDVDEILEVPVPPGAGARQRLAAAVRWCARLRRWTHGAASVTALLAHRSPWLPVVLRAGGVGAIVQQAPDDPARHRLEQLSGLLRGAGITAPADGLQPRLHLSAEEQLRGEAWWLGAPRPRWILAPGGGANPWAAMPTRRWPPGRFAELALRAATAGVSLRWLGGAEDAALVAGITRELPAAAARSLAGRLSLRDAAAACAAADLVIGNDSLPLVLAHALGRPGLGLYGPTSGAAIHAPGQAWLQGQAGCGPCYDSRRGLSGTAYTCPRPRCMEAIPVGAVWAAACGAREAAYG
ncbi:MAG TPA: glycosyltransferase family 9 protein [Terriglobales bacterium]|nr:glycosyltransferase family 9 protein [Terriglobales bacterium]